MIFYTLLDTMQRCPGQSIDGKRVAELFTDNTTALEGGMLTDTFHQGKFIRRQDYAYCISFTPKIPIEITRELYALHRNPTSCGERSDEEEKRFCSQAINRLQGQIMSRKCPIVTLLQLCK
jgi:hypothetical protein